MTDVGRLIPEGLTDGVFSVAVVCVYVWYVYVWYVYVSYVSYHVWLPAGTCLHSMTRV